MTVPQIVWLRRDLRLADQPAFCAAAAEGPVIPVYVLDDARPGARKLGGASRWWLHGSLRALEESLADHGLRLILRRGDSVRHLAEIARETGGVVHAIRHYEPWWREAQDMLGREVELHLHDGNYLAPPGTATTGSGTPFKIYAPFARALTRLLPLRDPLDVPELTGPSTWPASDALDQWQLLPAIRTGHKAFARPGRRERPPPTPGWSTSSILPRTTTRTAIAPRSMGPRVSRRICIGERFRPPRSGMRSNA